MAARPALVLAIGILSFASLCDAFLPLLQHPLVVAAPHHRHATPQGSSPRACEQGMMLPGSGSHSSVSRKRVLASSALALGVLGGGVLGGGRPQKATAMTMMMSDKAPVGYQDISVSVGGEKIPVSVWYPPSTSESTQARPTQAQYPHKISVGKIATLLTRGSLSVPSFVGPSTTLASGVRVLEGAAPAEGRPVIIFAHGYLGSRYDMMHVCEDLASRGFVVAAPELPESLAASFTVNDAITRPAIVNAALEKLRLNFAVTDKKGIFGHSAGGGTSTMIEGTYLLGRVAIAGFRGYEGKDPLLVVASRGDGIIPMDRVRDALPRGAELYEGAEGAKRLTSSGYNIGQGQSAAVFFEGGLVQGSLPPNHISFLSEQSNDALVNFLSPLLPVARVLSVPVLDFDKYQEARDSRQTGDVVVPLVSGFFESNAK